MNNLPEKPNQSKSMMGTPEESAIESDIKGLKKFIKLAKERLSSLSNPAQGVLTPGQGIGKNKKILIISVVLVLVLGGLLVLSLLVKNSREDKKEVKPSPSPSATTLPEGGIGRPSRYATDSAVLKIEAEVKELEKTLDETQLKESDLTPPQIDFEIKFN